MSLISGFIQNQLIKALEAEFVAHSDDLQAAFVGEIKNLVSLIGSWAESKIAAQSAPVEAVSNTPKAE